MTTWIRPRPDGSLEWCRSGNGLPAEQEWEALELEGEQGIPADKTVTVLVPPDVLWHLRGIPVWVLPPSGRRWLVRLKEALQIAELRWSVAPDGEEAGSRVGAAAPPVLASPTTLPLQLRLPEVSPRTLRRLALGSGLALLLAALSSLSAARTSRRLESLRAREGVLLAELTQDRLKADEASRASGILPGSHELSGWASWAAATLAASIPASEVLSRLDLQWDPPLDTSAPALPSALSWRLELKTEARERLGALIAALDQTSLPMTRLVLETAGGAAPTGDGRRPVLSGRYLLWQDE